MANDNVTRVLVVAERSVDPGEIDRELDLDDEAEIKVIAPTLAKSKLDLLTGGIDDEIGEAEARAEQSAGSAEAVGDAAVAKPEAGDADPLLAIEDALATFDADQIVLVPHAPDRQTWAEEGLLEEARERFPIPVREIEARGG